MLSMCGGGGRQNPCNALLDWPDEGNPYNDEHVQWDTSTKQIKVIDSKGKDLCLTAASSQKLFWYPCKYNQSQKWQIGDATVLPSDDDPPSEPTPSLCAAENCAAPGACLIIDGHKHGVPNKFHCEVNPLHFTDASVCEGPPDRGIWCDAPP